MFRKACGALCVMIASGCAPEFGLQSRITSVRIMAVQKDKPYAKPGDTVHLNMLLADGADGEDFETRVGAPDLDVRWVGGCENPPGDLYATCFSDVLSGEASQDMVQYGYGLEFQVDLSSDIISRRPRPVDPKQPPYGLSYVFFGACAGEIRITPPAEADGFPIGCFDQNDERLGADDFVSGYVAIFVYDEFTNANPVIEHFTVNGECAEPECVNEECIPLMQEELGVGPSGLGLFRPGPGENPGPALDAGLMDGGVVGSGDAGAPDGGTGSGSSVPRRCPDYEPRVNPCDDENESGEKLPPDPRCVSQCVQTGKCTTHTMSLIVDPDSAEVDTVSEARGDRILEQMWINYYMENGSIDGDVKLLNDATEGFIEDHGTEFTVAREPGIFRMWAVAHDNRGGMSYARLKMQRR